MENPFGVCLQPQCTDEDLPSTPKMVKNLLSTAKDIVSGVLRGEDVYVSDDEATRRLSICSSCPFFVQESKRCTKCGCFMEKKVLFTQTHCPIDKWS